MSISRSYYKILGVSPSADVATLRRAFRNLSKLLHPDTTSLPADQAAREFQEVCEAYELLSDPLFRKEYDKRLGVTVPQNTTLSPRNVVVRKNVGEDEIALDVRRPLSGGELFSLFILGITILVSLFLGIGFAMVEGRDLQVRPSWLIVDQVSIEASSRDLINFYASSS